uniref:Uncharacterized protein n=1 Tax=Glossina pallidipes TaxID=7398 RepID=A0A1A9ZSM1_GLOPL
MDISALCEYFKEKVCFTNRKGSKKAGAVQDSRQYECIFLIRSQVLSGLQITDIMNEIYDSSWLLISHPLNTVYCITTSSLYTSSILSTASTQKFIKAEYVNEGEDWKSVNAINYLLKLTEHLTINSHYGPWFTLEGSLITKESFKKYPRYGFYPNSNQKCSSMSPDQLNYCLD